MINMINTGDLVPAKATQMRDLAQDQDILRITTDLDHGKVTQKTDLDQDRATRRIMTGQGPDRVSLFVRIVWHQV